MSSAVEQAHVITDAFMEKAVQKSVELGRTVKCSEGCFHCCREPVYADRAEAQHILDGLSFDERESLKRKVAEWFSKFRSRNLHQSKGPDVAPGGSAGSEFGFLLRYREAALWCPLLVDGRCSAYANRPIGCRMHFALGHPAKCEKDHDRPKQQFLVTSTWPIEIMGALADNAPAALFEFDHLGIWLAVLLLGETERSRAAKNLMVTQTDPA